MEAELRENLITLATAYAAAKGMEMATVAQRALGDWRFFQRLEESDRASFTVRKYDAAIDWFAANWPPEAKWPEHITRPRQAGAAA